VTGGLGDRRQADAAARRAGDEVVRHGGVEDGPEHVILPPDRPGRRLGGPGSHESLDVPGLDRAQAAGLERGEQVVAQDRLVSCPGTRSLARRGQPFFGPNAVTRDSAGSM
jgi:hypothetical protein